MGSQTGGRVKLARLQPETQPAGAIGTIASRPATGVRNAVVAGSALDSFVGSGTTPAQSTGQRFAVAVRPISSVCATRR